MQRAQASTVPLAALGKAANSQPWNIKYIWPVEHVLQNGSDPAWGGECCFHGEQDSPQHHLVSIHQSHFLFFAKHQEIRGEVTIFTTGGGRERTTILRKKKKTLHNYSSLAAPHRSRPMSSPWQRPPGPESPHSPPHHHLPLHPARPLNAQLQRDGLLAKHGRQAFLWRAGALRDARSLARSSSSPGTETLGKSGLTAVGHVPYTLAKTRQVDLNQLNGTDLNPTFHHDNNKILRCQTQAAVSRSAWVVT